MNEKVYTFWSRLKDSNDRYVWTELAAKSKQAVKEWAKLNNVEIEKNRIYIK